MSAAVLREAAALMRERAEAATPGPWSAADEHELLDGSSPTWCVSNMRPGFEAMSPTKGYLGDVAETSLGFHQPCDEYNALHIASWHPAVALAVADWLDHQATSAERAERFQAYDERHWMGALTIARAYLGSDQ